MKALITGSAGFVGRHIYAELDRRGWEVNGWDIADGADACLIFSGAYHFTPFDLIVHCAFNVGGRAVIDGDRTALAKNLMLDAAMFDWAVRTGQTRILYFSSSAVYPTFLQRKPHFNVPPMGYRLKESDAEANEIGRPDADYGYAKMVGEQLAENAREMGINVHVVRPFSGYAEDQSLDYPFPAILKRARGGDLTVWGPEGQTRDWIHIDDLVAGALAVVHQDYQEPVNLCTGIGTEMGELARMVNDEVRGSVYHPDHMSLPPAPKVEYLTDKPTGVFNRVGDPTIFHTIYTPKISLEEGVRRALSK